MKLINIDNFSRKLIFFYIFFSVFIGSVSVFSPLNEYGEFFIPGNFYILFDILSVFVFFVLTCFAFFKFPSESVDNIFISWFFFCFFLILFSLYGFYTLSYTEYVHYFLRNQFFYVFLGGVVFYYCLRIDYDIFNSFMFFLLICQIFFSLIVILLEFFMGGYFWEGSRLTGSLVNHNSYGVFLVFFSFWILSSYAGESWKRYSLWASIAILVVLSGSVTAILGVALSVLRNFRSVFFLFLFFIFSFTIFYDDIMNLHFVWKINQIFFEDSTHLTSLSARERQFDYFLSSVSDPDSWFFGVNSEKEYMRFDSQYYNIFFNFGIFPFLSFLLMAFFIVKKHIKSWFFIYYLWFFVVACSMTAFFSRPIMIILFFFFLANTCLFERNAENMC